MLALEVKFITWGRVGIGMYLATPASTLLARLQTMTSCFDGQVALIQAMETVSRHIHQLEAALGAAVAGCAGLWRRYPLLLSSDQGFSKVHLPPWSEAIFLPATGLGEGGYLLC